MKGLEDISDDEKTDVAGILINGCKASIINESDKKEEKVLVCWKLVELSSLTFSLPETTMPEYKIAECVKQTLRELKYFRKTSGTITAVISKIVASFSEDVISRTSSPKKN